MSNIPTTDDVYEDQEHYEVDKSNAAVVQTTLDEATEGTITAETQEHYAASLNEEQDEVRREIAAERKFQDESKRDTVVTVSTNYSRQVRFRRYAMEANRVLRICDNKPLRGDLVVTIISGGPAYVGTSPGITAGGLDTGTITGSRTIRTSEKLYAVTDQVSCIIDIQEEFD